jgi:hypothetical protein
MTECFKIEDHLSEYMDDVLDSKTKIMVEEHLKACEACQGEFNALKSLASKLQRLEPVQAPANFLAQVHGRLSPPSKARRWLDSLFYPLPVRIPIQIGAIATATVALILALHLIKPTIESAKQAPVDQQVGLKEKKVASSASHEQAQAVPSKSESPKAQKTDSVTPSKPVVITLLIHQTNAMNDSPTNEFPAPAYQPETSLGKEAKREESNDRFKNDKGIDSTRSSFQNYQDENSSRLNGVTDNKKLAPEEQPMAPSVVQYDETAMIQHIALQLNGRIVENQEKSTTVESDKDNEKHAHFSKDIQLLTIEIESERYEELLNRLSQAGAIQPPLPLLSDSPQEIVQIQIQLIYEKR